MLYRTALYTVYALHIVQYGTELYVTVLYTVLHRIDYVYMLYTNVHCIFKN